jgi:hypothetical protein
MITTIIIFIEFELKLCLLKLLYFRLFNDFLYLNNMPFHYLETFALGGVSYIAFETKQVARNLIKEELPPLSQGNKKKGGLGNS